MEFKNLTAEETEALLATETNKEARKEMLSQLIDKYNNVVPIKSYKAAEQLMALAKEDNDPRSLMRAYIGQCTYLMDMGDYDSSIVQAQELRRLAEVHDHKKSRVIAHHFLGNAFSCMSRWDHALEQYLLAIELAKGGVHLTNRLLSSCAICYAQSGDTEKGITYFKEALVAAEEEQDFESIAQTNLQICQAYRQIGKFEEALKYGNEGLKVSKPLKSRAQEAHAHMTLGVLYSEMHNFEVAESELKKSLELYTNLGLKSYISWTHDYLSTLYERWDKHSLALEHFRTYHTLQQESITESALKKTNSLEAQMEVERKEREFEVRLANTRLQTLTKVASDIAHEIQNPLQFVNNFSEVNIDLSEEMDEYVDADNKAGYKETSKNLKDNSQKIRDHGLRISKIVDQLLEQTRKAEKGELEPGGESEHDFSR